MKISSFFIACLLFILIFWTTGNYAQTYKSSLGVNYGLYQYNSNQNNQVFNAEGNFLNAGLNYKYKTGRYTSLGISGRLYSWQFSDFLELTTQSLEGKGFVHVGRISNSWRINLITPYIGAGLGYEMHTLLLNKAKSTYENAYIPIEAGFNFNLGPRLSLGVFAEYKLSPKSDLKTRLGLENGYPAAVNGAGIVLSWQFGRKKTEINVPVVTTYHYPDNINKDNSLNDTIENEQKILSDSVYQAMDSLQLIGDTKQESSDHLLQESYQPTLMPEVLKAFIDTIRIPVILDFSVKGFSDQGISPFSINVQNHLDTGSVNAKMDSLLRLTENLRQRLSWLEGTNTGQFSQNNQNTLPYSIGGPTPQNQQPQRITNQQPTQSLQPAPTPFGTSTTRVTRSGSENLATKADIEALRAEIRQLANENIGNTEIRNPARLTSGIPDYQNTTDRELQRTSINPQIDYDMPLFGDDNRFLSADTIELPVSEQNDFTFHREDQAFIDSILAEKDELAEDLKFQQEQTIKLKDEIDSLILKDEPEIQNPEPEHQKQQTDEEITIQHVIYFELNSTKISLDDLNTINLIAKKLTDNPDIKLQLSGYADATGDPEYNALLSRWRVSAVRDELMKVGIPQVRIFEQHFGSKTATGGLNSNERRVEIKTL